MLIFVELFLAQNVHKCESCLSCERDYFVQEVSLMFNDRQRDFPIRISFLDLRCHFVFSILIFVLGIWIDDAYKGKLNCALLA